MRALWELCALFLVKSTRTDIHLPADLRERLWGYCVRNFLLSPHNVGWLLGTNTTHLSLYGYSHTRQAFLEQILAISGLATRLTALSLHCNFRVEEGGFGSVTWCPNLEWLELYGCVGLTDGNLVDICRHCTKLTECVLVTDEALIEGVAPHLPHLASLRISGTAFDGPAFSCLAKLTGLTALDMAGCFTAKPDFHALSALTALRSLSLNSTNLEDDHLVQIVRRCTDIRRLQLSRCQQLEKAATLREVLVSLPRLETLSVAYNTSVSVASFASGGVGGTPKILSTSLTDLDVSGCEGMSNAALGGLCQSLPGLTRLSLGKCRAISDWSPLLRSGLASSLTQLNLNSTTISDAALALLARHMAALVSLELMECRNVSAAGLLCFIDGGQALRSLKLSWRGYRETLVQLRERRPEVQAVTIGI